jgi:hypothetical protein
MYMSEASGSTKSGNVKTAVDLIQKHLGSQDHCGTKFLVSYYRGAVVAVYSGASIDNSQTLPSVLQQLSAQMADGDKPAAKSMALQLCGESRNADYTLGIAIDTTGDLAAVQKTIKGWSDGTCVDGLQPAKQLSDISVYEAPIISVPDSGNSSAANSSVHRRRHDLHARADCRTITVVSKDTCALLATKCGISGADFTKFNPASNLCSTLAIGQRVCCSSGSLPDITPKPNANGTCATYTVKNQDTCSQIAASNGITAAQIETFNTPNTWGWTGCNNLMAGVSICLSKGTPPLPAPVSNAVCGPTVPGTKYPPAGKTLADLNPCPLNSCCDIWGQCGITPEYCTADLGPTKNPGTAPPGKNGCISNCGTQITNK